MLKIAIVDDEWESAEILENCLRSYTEEFGTEFSIAHYKTGFDFLDAYKPVFDAVFMDINMPQLSGLKTARELRKIDSEIVIVFVTAFGKYAINGYEVAALDFCMKPISYDVFKTKISHVVSACMVRGGETVALPYVGGTLRIAVSAIDYVEVTNHNVVYHTSRGKIRAYCSLQAVEDILPKERFAKCSRCYLVNLRSVTHVDKSSVYIGESKLAITRTRHDEFIKALSAHGIMR